MSTTPIRWSKTKIFGEIASDKFIFGNLIELYIPYLSCACNEFSWFLKWTMRGQQKNFFWPDGIISEILNYHYFLSLCLLLLPFLVFLQDTSGDKPFDCCFLFFSPLWPFLFWSRLTFRAGTKGREQIGWMANDELAC